jgi:hypothetical protein
MCDKCDLLRDLTRSMEQRWRACTTASCRLAAVRCQSNWLYTSRKSVTSAPENAASPLSHLRVHVRLITTGVSTGTLYEVIAVATPASIAALNGGKQCCSTKDSGSHAGPLSYPERDAWYLQQCSREGGNASSIATDPFNSFCSSWAADQTAAQLGSSMCYAGGIPAGHAVVTVFMTRGAMIQNHGRLRHCCTWSSLADPVDGDVDVENQYIAISAFLYTALLILWCSTYLKHGPHPITPRNPDRFDWQMNVAAPSLEEG